jgi:4-hydroxybenzoate polyprenyltransferase
MMSSSDSRPLCVDCDGTLIRTDLLHEAVFLLLKHSFLSILLVPLWLLRGKAYMKDQIAHRVDIDPALLPYHEPLIAYLRSVKSQGRKIVLATASPMTYANAVARHVGVFDRVEATQNGENLSAEVKAKRLVALYGERGFDYAGNSVADIPVWSKARGAIVVNASLALVARVEKLTPVVRHFERMPPRWADYVMAMRFHQWVKNVLVFVPLLTSHRFLDFYKLAQIALAFLAYGLCASSVYLMNDLLDLNSDRQHPRKSKRPFASGVIPISTGAILIPMLLFLTIGVARLLPPLFGILLGGYYLTTWAYSLWLKRRPIVDVITLAILYTFRILTGAAAADVPPSFWLLAFSMFIFLSLAMVKRYSELFLALSQKKTTTAGRGYSINDMPLLENLGSSSGYLAILVMALYLNSPEVTILYGSPQLLWLLLPPLLFWINRLWMKTHRGEIDEDPVVFAVTDRTSLFVAAICGLVLFAAAMTRGVGY